MNFVSSAYLIFLAVIFVSYWCMKRRAQNVLLLAASYFFYAQWDWRFLSLIMISTVVDFIVGRKIHESEVPATRKMWLVVSMIFNLGLLGFFKYFNFFAESLVNLAGGLGLYVSSVTLDIILPVGISFYTFQTMSYSLDIYRRELEPTRSFTEFAAFVAFFPQLVAGPIVRAKEFLYQLEVSRKFRSEDFESGLIRFLLGYFKKAFVADTIAIYLVDPVFANPESYTQGTLWIATVGYTIQVYADFSGYSSMAIGSARMLGFRIPENFEFPYLSLSISEFWRRWHMTMSRWFRDYVYIGLGGNRVGFTRTMRNLVITVFISGLWHGAAWSFIVFGLAHGLFMAVHQVWRRVKSHWNIAPVQPSGLFAIPAWILTTMAAMIAFTIFRTRDLATAGQFFAGMAGSVGTNSIEPPALVWFAMSTVIIDHFAGALMARKKTILARIPRLVQAAVLVAIILILYNAVPEDVHPFIYFQF